MKKHIKITVISLIIALVSIVNVYAAGETDVTATADKTETKVEDTITINLSANCETGIEGIDSTLVYDKTKLELSNLSVDAKFSNMSGTDDSTGEYKLTVISNSEEILTSGIFATLEFKVLDTAKADETLTIKLVGIEIGDSNDEWTTIDDKEITLKIVEENSGTDDNNPDEDNNNSGTGDSNLDEDNDNSETGDNNQEGDNKNSETDNNNSSENNNSGTDTLDNTQANKPIDYAGLESYAFVIIAIIAIVAVISYKKYKYISI